MQLHQILKTFRSPEYKIKQHCNVSEAVCTSRGLNKEDEVNTKYSP